MDQIQTNKPAFKYIDHDLETAKATACSPGSNPSVILSRTEKRFQKMPNGDICDFEDGEVLLKGI